MVLVTSRSKAWTTRRVRGGLASVPEPFRTPLILDTSGAIALLNSADDAHEACVRVAAADVQLIVPPLTLVELDHWCGRSGAGPAFVQFLHDIRTGSYELADLPVADVQRSLDLMERYHDLDLGIVDASVVALAERLRVTTVLTLDRRDFSVVRPRHCSALTLVPN